MNRSLDGVVHLLSPNDVGVVGTKSLLLLNWHISGQLKDASVLLSTNAVSVLPGPLAD